MKGMEDFERDTTLHNHAGGGGESVIESRIEFHTFFYIETVWKEIDKVKTWGSDLMVARGFLEWFFFFFPFVMMR